MQVHVVKVSWNTHRESLQAIRTQVFVVEQEVSPDDEWDEDDKIADHFLALNEAGQALGCARLIASGQIGRMAVLSAERGKGLGALLLQAAVEEAKAQKMNRVFLHAQSYAEAFYKKGGFIVCGPGFSEVGIPHLPMEMKLPLEFEAPQVDARPALRADLTIERETNTEINLEAHPFDGIDQAREALLNLITSTERQIYILSPYLDHELFDDSAVTDAISHFVRAAPRAEVRILIMSSKLVVDRGHRLVELARRLDQKIKLRWHDEEISESTSSFVCGDFDRYWLLPVYDQYDGVFDPNDVVLTRRFVQTFTTAWDRSKSDPELRTLRL